MTGVVRGQGRARISPNGDARNAGATFFRSRRKIGREVGLTVSGLWSERKLAWRSTRMSLRTRNYLFVLVLIGFGINAGLMLV